MCTRRCDRVIRLQNRIVENLFRKYYDGNVNTYKSIEILKFAAFNICCPRDCVSRHNGGTSGAPLKPLRVDSALQISID